MASSLRLSHLHVWKPKKGQKCVETFLEEKISFQRTFEVCRFHLLDNKEVSLLLLFFFGVRLYKNLRNSRLTTLPERSLL